MPLREFTLTPLPRDMPCARAHKARVYSCDAAHATALRARAAFMLLARRRATPAMLTPLPRMPLRADAAFAGVSRHAD